MIDEAFVRHMLQRLLVTPFTYYFHLELNHIYI
jgi:hypothetical protein